MDQSSLLILIIGMVTAILSLIANALPLIVRFLERKDHMTQVQGQHIIEPPVQLQHSSEIETPGPLLLEMIGSHEANDPIAKNEATHMSSSDPVVGVDSCKRDN